MGNKARRAMTEMSAMYTPLRDLVTVAEEMSVVFVTAENTEHHGSVCVGPDHSGVLNVTLWVHGASDVYSVAFGANDCLWCRVSDVDILFWKRPVHTSDVSLRFKFDSAAYTSQFMRSVMR